MTARLAPNGKSRLCAASAAPMYRDATNVNEARKALKTQACPGIGHIMGSAAVIVNGENFRKISGCSSTNLTW